MRPISSAITLALLAALAGCAASHSTIPAGSQSGGARSAFDTAEAMPGDTAEALPGDTAEALPGSRLACSPAAQSGEASCTVAININIAPLANPQAPAAAIPGLHPGDLQSAYALPSQNAGGTVAIVDAYDDPAAESDLAVYRTAFGLPACNSNSGCFRKVNERGSTSSVPAPNSGWAQEIALDLDMVSAACPNCAIVLVESDSASIDDLGAGVDTAAALGVMAISNSYYAAEWSAETNQDAHFRHEGIAITASAGDSSRPFYPAASPYVTAVGGTTLSGSPGAWNQSAWPYGGRGCSAYEGRPAWQHQTACKSRSTVDVSAVADPQTGVAMYDSLSGGWLVAGGTSVGAPLIAAAYALSGDPAGPAFSYAHPASFFEIAAMPYDAATGLGTPRGVSGL